MSTLKQKLNSQFSWFSNVEFEEFFFDEIEILFSIAQHWRKFRARFSWDLPS